MDQSLPGKTSAVHPASQPAIVTDFELRLEVSHVLAGHGIPTADASEALRAAAQAVIDEAHSLLAPAAMYAILPVRDFEHEQVILDNGATFKGSLAARALAGAHEVAVAVCTIGSALEERMSALFVSRDALRALALEGAGVAAVGQVANAVGIHLCNAAAGRGLSVGMRASPGQEGWSIQQQRTLFSLIPAEQIGVRLTSSYLMLPRKSVSFVMGLGPDMRADAVPCDFCSKREHCQWRRGKAR
jgi:hypothetical protein